MLKAAYLNPAGRTLPLQTVEHDAIDEVSLPRRRRPWSLPT